MAKSTGGGFAELHGFPPLNPWVSRERVGRRRAVRLLMR